MRGLRRLGREAPGLEVKRMLSPIGSLTPSTRAKLQCLFQASPTMLRGVLLLPSSRPFILYPFRISPSYRFAFELFTFSQLKHLNPLLLHPLIHLAAHSMHLHCLCRMYLFHPYCKPFSVQCRYTDYLFCICVLTK